MISGKFTKSSVVAGPDELESPRPRVNASTAALLHPQDDVLAPDTQENTIDGGADVNDGKYGMHMSVSDVFLSPNFKKMSVS